MPVYNFYCSVCDTRDEVFIKLANLDSNGWCVCPVCGDAGARRLPSAPAIIGPTDTKPFIHKQTGAVCTTASEKRAWERAQFSDGSRPVMAGSVDALRHEERARTKADALAKKSGYDSHEHRSRAIKAEQRRQKTGERKIISTSA